MAGTLSDGRRHQRQTVDRPDADDLLSPRDGFVDGAVLRGAPRPDLIRDEVLSEIFCATAASRPDHPALRYGGEAFTYAEVHRRTDALAWGLVSHGIGVGDIVGIWMARGADALLAQIAITKAGAAWLPLDAEAPADRVVHSLSHAGASAVIVDERAEGHEMPCRPFVCAALAAAEAQPLPRRAAGLTPDSPAYLIYTSGSTGAPKGIVITHRNVCHFLRAANEIYGIDGTDVVFQGASLAFDLSVEEVWVPYLVGATLLVADTATLTDLERLPDVITAAGVTVLDTVPTLLGLIGRDLPSVRTILLGGEALPPALVDRWAPGRTMFNTYGPTEATVVTTVAQVRRGEPVTIGRPLPNYTCYVAEGTRLLPAGTPGELLIGGPGVANGYLGRPERTAEKFIRNPFSEEGGDPVLYRSGDAVRLDFDGSLVFLGRIDDQVKIRGFRVELGEIETHLTQINGIRQAAVVLRQDDGIDRLVAFLVQGEGEPLDPSALREILGRAMPPYMIPTHFEPVAALPMLSSGKVDRRALERAELTVVEAIPDLIAPGDDAAPEGAPTPDVPSHDTIETELSKVWTRVLSYPPESLDQNFFTCGGNSLLAMRFIALVNEALALRLSISAFVHHPTIRATAAIVRAGLKTSSSSLHALSVTGARPALFAAGSSREYKQLSAALGPDQPFYQLDTYALLERQDLDGEPLYGSVREIAAHFIRDMRLVQPNGPYYIAGHCDGAVIAFEIALQLQAAGEAIALLAIFDTPPEGDFTKLPIARRAWYLLRSNQLMSRIKARASERISCYRPAKGEGRHSVIFGRIWSAIAEYQPDRRFQGEIQLLRALETYGVFRDVAIGWNARATSGVKLRDVPGNHYLLFCNPQTQEVVRQVLTEAQRPPRASIKIAKHSWVTVPPFIPELLDRLVILA